VAPTRRGFGTALLKTAFPNIILDYAIEGFNCEIDVLLREVEPGVVPGDAAHTGTLSQGSGRSIGEAKTRGALRTRQDRDSNFA
jgi:hypothetical protein